jgi:hypothetical protein
VKGQRGGCESCERDNAPSLGNIFTNINRLPADLEARSLSHLDILTGGAELRQQHAVLDGLDIIPFLLRGQIRRLEPVGDHETRRGLAAARYKQFRDGAEEERLVGEMRQRFRDPDGVELLPFGLSVDGRGEVLEHPLRVELNEAAIPSRGVGVDIRVQLVGGFVAGGSGIGRGFGLGEPLRDLDLAPADGDARHAAPVLLGQVPRRAAETAPDVEDLRASGQIGDLEEVLHQIDLGFLLGLRGRLEIAMVDVLTPAASYLAILSRVKNYSL